jgi:hypothetical protein
MVLKENLKFPITPSGRDIDAAHKIFEFCGFRPCLRALFARTRAETKSFWRRRYLTGIMRRAGARNTGSP